jgi:hypothetical protein
LKEALPCWLRNTASIAAAKIKKTAARLAVYCRVSSFAVCFIQIELRLSLPLLRAYFFSWLRIVRV